MKHTAMIEQQDLQVVSTEMVSISLKVDLWSDTSYSHVNLDLVVHSVTAIIHCSPKLKTSLLL